VIGAMFEALYTHVRALIYTGAEGRRETEIADGRNGSAI